MSDLLINWLNDEAQLSRRIVNFQEDFHNGYLFGELLSKYSQQLDFDKFVDKNDKASRILNFSLLYDTFRTLRVSYDSNIAMTIIQKKIGIAKKLLYQLKMQLEKTTSMAFTKQAKSVKPLSPLKKIPLSKDKFDKISKEHFTKQLNEMHRAQKNINLDNHLQKFPQFHQKQQIKAYNQERKQANGILLGQSKFRNQQIQNIKKSADFRNQWEQSNLQKWAANMTVRQLQNQKNYEYKANIDNVKIQSKTFSELNAIKALDNDIKSFEKRVKAEQNKPRDSSSSQEDEKGKSSNIQAKNSALLKKKSTHQFAKKTNQFQLNQSSKALGSTINKEQLDVKKKKMPQQVELLRHQREKRRRKMIVQQSKKYQLIKIERRQRYILSTLQQTSKQQKQIEYEIWRAWQNREVIKENKSAQIEKIKEKQDTRTVNSKFKDDELTKTYREQHNKIQLKDACNRQGKMKIQNSAKQRKEVYNECRGFVQKFVDMMEVLYENGQQKNIEELDESYIDCLMNQFVSDASSKKEISDLELKNYICGKGQWKIKITKDSEDQPENPTQENALPTNTVNNYYLGNILKTVFTELYQQQEQKSLNQSACKNLIALIGLDFAGKTTISDRIRENFGYHIIHVSQLIEQKINDLISLTEKGVEIQGDSSEILRLSFEGKQIPNSLILSVLKEEIQKHQQCLLLNYPTTYEQCIQFTDKFGNVKPTDKIQKNKLMTKIEQFSRLVWPTETKTIPRSLKPCGLDLALWVQISPKTSLDRFLGRRWTPTEQCVHINNDIEDPKSLSIGEKASSTIMKNNFKIKNKSKIQNWLNQFGINVVDGDQQKIQLCWQTISGQSTSQNVLEKAIDVFRKAINLKEKKINQIKLKQLEAEETKKKQIENQQFEKQLKQKCVLSNPEQIAKKHQQAANSMKISESFLKNIQNLWNNTEKLSVNSFLNVFQAIREQDQSKNKYISSTKKKFIKMLTREDERFYLVKKFQNDYNAFFDGNQDMVNQQYTKEELHQRIQDLEVDLLTLIQEKKDDASSECQNIMSSGWLESQLQQIISFVHVILQTQLNRSFACQQIISDFYSKKYMVPTSEIGQTQLTLNIDESLDLIKDDTFPRLEKLLSEAIRLFNKQQEVVDDKNKKGGKAPPKKDDKKAGKKGGKQEVEEVKEPTPEQLEYKKALNTQKAIFRYRSKIISSYAIKRLIQFNKVGKKCYEDLEDLYKYTDRVEKKSVLNMTKIVKKTIEEQRKIQNQVLINYTQVTQTQLIRNFEKPKPIIQPATEQTQNDRFSISGLKQIIKTLTKLSEAGLVIKTKSLIGVFDQFAMNENHRMFLPTPWKNLKPKQWGKFLTKFDKQGKGQIQLWSIFQILALSNVVIPSKKQIEVYELLLCDHNPNVKQIKREKIEGVSAWFDSEEPTIENTRKFDRNKYLKSILFNIHRKDEETDTVLLQKYIKRLTLKDYNGSDNEGITYFEFGFPIDEK